MGILEKNVEDMLRSLPDDSTVEDIQYHLYVLDKIQRGQDAIRDGNGITHEEAKSRLSKWIINKSGHLKLLMISKPSQTTLRVIQSHMHNPQLNVFSNPHKS